jgi:hypothetical protein
MTQNISSASDKRMALWTTSYQTIFSDISLLIHIAISTFASRSVTEIILQE